MLYNGLVKFIMQAQEGIEAADMEKSNTANIKAQNIVNHLRNTLDMRYNVSQNLDEIYEYMGRRLFEANIKKDKAILEEVLGYAKELRETWEKAMKLAKKPVKAEKVV